MSFSLSDLIPGCLLFLTYLEILFEVLKYSASYASLCLTTSLQLGFPIFLGTTEQTDVVQRRLRCLSRKRRSLLRLHQPRLVFASAIQVYHLFSFGSVQL